MTEEDQMKILGNAYQRYADNDKPYANADQLSQKLWYVVAREFGPNEADILNSKLMQAVEDHIVKGGVRH